MSQYPYQPSPYIPGYYNPMPMMPFRLSKARSAGNWQIVLSMLMILFGGLMTVMLWSQPPDALLNAMQQQRSNVQIPEVPGWTPGELVRFVVTIVAGGAGFIGLLLLLLAFFVRGGSRGAMIFSCVVVGGLLMFMGVGAVGAISNPASGITGFIMLAVPLVLSIGIMTRLISALRQPGGAPALTQQQAYWMMMQQQQMQPPHGYGYGAYPPAAAPGNSPMPPILPGMPPQNPPPNYPQQ
jgi:hypothetical protein